MNIVYACDDNYAEVAGTSIASLYDNNKEAENLNIYLFNNGISNDNKQMLNTLASNYNRELIYIDISDMDMNKLCETNLYIGRWSITVYAYLFIAKLLPLTIERVICLGCDTIINDSLTPLWNENLGGCIIGGVDLLTENAFKNAFNISESSIFINYCMMLIDLKTWRKYNVEKYLVSYIKLTNGYTYTPGESAVNYVLQKHIKSLNPRYNYMPNAVHNDLYLHPKSKIDIKHVKENPLIIHYLTSDKRPWVNGGEKLPYSDIYLKYRDITPWKHVPLRNIKHNNKIIKRKMGILYKNAVNLLPLSIARYISYSRLQRFRLKKARSVEKKNLYIKEELKTCILPKIGS
ncbi:MAG: glycosyltransferase family 8 protein [Oscillospiraceae bacterium]|nr:glycosyltransferase family 8 protein [Oscillospiraceae bacterium]